MNKMDWGIFWTAVGAFIGGVGLVGAALLALTKLLLESGLEKHRAQLLEEMNGKYIRTREQLKDNARFEERLNDADERIDSHAARLREYEQKGYVPHHRHPEYETRLDSMESDCSRRMKTIEENQRVVQAQYTEWKHGIKSRAAGA